MRYIEVLEKKWREGAHLGRLYANLSLEKDGLVLGAGTVLAKRDADGALEIAGEEARALTLLAVAHGRPIDVSVIDAIRRASKYARAGNLPMASMHIALGGLPRLSDPFDSARRMFIADGLLARGVRPKDIFAALEFDPAPLDDIEKEYNPSELRNPKGDGRISGEWAREIEEAETTIEDAAEEVSRNLPRVAARIASRVAAVLEPFVFPPPAGGKDDEGPVQGHPELRYLWNEDGAEVLIVRQLDGHVVLTASLDPKSGGLRVGPTLVGRKTGDMVVIYPFALPRDGMGEETRNDPRLCPKETLDRQGGSEKVRERARDYEDQVKRWVNPGNPTWRGYGYAFVDPLTGNDVVFDDCQHRTGIVFEFKGTGIAKHLGNREKYPDKNFIEKAIDQAERQVRASQGRPIVWVFAERDAAVYFERLFHNENHPDLNRIEVYTFPKEQ